MFHLKALARLFSQSSQATGSSVTPGRRGHPSRVATINRAPALNILCCRPGVPRTPGASQCTSHRGRGRGSGRLAEPSWTAASPACPPLLAAFAAWARRALSGEPPHRPCSTRWRRPPPARTAYQLPTSLVLCPSLLAGHHPTTCAGCREGGQRLLSAQQESAASLGMGIEASASPPRLPRSEERGALLKGQGPTSSSSGGLQPAASPPMPPPFFPPAARHKSGGSGSPGGGSPKAGKQQQQQQQQQLQKDKGGSKLSLFEDDDDTCPTCLEPYTGAPAPRGAARRLTVLLHRLPPAGSNSVGWPIGRWHVACKQYLASLQKGC